MNQKTHGRPLPRSVDEAAQRLLSDFLIQHLRELAKLTETEFDLLCSELAPHISSEFDLWQGNNALMASCLASFQNDRDEPVRIILNRVRDLLQDCHGLFILT